MTGDWRNIDPNKRSVTRVVIGFACGDVVLCAGNGNCSASYTGYLVDVLGTCHRTDCVWGRQKAVLLHHGWVRATYYHFGFATAYVWLQTHHFGAQTYVRVFRWTVASEDFRGSLYLDFNTEMHAEEGSAGFPA